METLSIETNWPSCQLDVEKGRDQDACRDEHLVFARMPNVTTHAAIKEMVNQETPVTKGVRDPILITFGPE